MCLRTYKMLLPPSLQPFSSGRQVVVERHSREQGLRKEWHGGSSSQGGGFPDNRRMGDARGSMMSPSRYSRHISWMSVQVKTLIPAIWNLNSVLLQSLVLWNESNCTDHQQLRSQWRKCGWIQALQRNTAAVLTVAKSCHFKAPENFLNSLFLDYQLF